MTGMTTIETHGYLLTCSEMRAAEDAAFARGETADSLMEEVGLGMARAVLRFFPKGARGSVVAFVGNGHNGGDALVAARNLREAGWEVFLHLAGGEKGLKPLTSAKRALLGRDVRRWDGGRDWSPADARPVAILDGLLGIGARGPLRGRYVEAARELNMLRLAEHAFCFALDIPSGVDGDSGEVHEGAVMADVTLTVGYAKPGLVADSSVNHVGRVVVIPVDRIAVLDDARAASARVLTARVLRGCLPRRAADFHKGNAGRVGIIAGSRGLMGAAVLASTAAVRGGAGLVTLLATEKLESLLVARVSSEVMVQPVINYRDAQNLDFDAFAIGPGIGRAALPELLALITSDARPMVLDADALNHIAQGDVKALLGNPPGPRLLTPHPGEMARLAGERRAGQTVRAWGEEFVANHRVTLLLKGSRTHICEAGKATSICLSGNAGMATGGVGDTLTGLAAALIGQGLPVFDAACVAAWLNGRAAEIALVEAGQSVESLKASDLPECFGRAFRDLREGTL